MKTDLSAMKSRILKALNKARVELEQNAVIEAPDARLAELRDRIATVEACDDVTKHPQIGKLFIDGRLSPLRVITLYIVSDGPAKGCAFTTNMENFDLPNIEIRNVPLFLIEGAFDVLNATAEYLLNTTDEVKLGQTLGLSDRCAVRFEKLDPVEGSPPEGRWTLTELPMACGQEDCEEKHGHARGRAKPS